MMLTAMLWAVCFAGSWVSGEGVKGLRQEVEGAPLDGSVSSYLPTTPGLPAPWLFSNSNVTYS